MKTRKSRIKIKDLPENRQISDAEWRKIVGGVRSLYRSVYPVGIRYYNSGGYVNLMR